METEKKPKVAAALEKYSTPISVLVGAIIIAFALSYSNGGIPQQGVAGSPNQPQQDPIAQQKQLDSIAPITAEDHIRGNPDAPVKIVEYSDTECPFCKRFHPTMQQVMEEYGADGKVAWIYRHLPLDQLHSKARKEAVALECAGDQGGDDAFWKYTDRLYEVTPSNDGLDPAELPKIAGEIGLDVSKFNTCLASNKFDAHIEANAQNAAATGGNGTPWSIVIGKNGKKYPLSGAQPYESVKQLIDLALQGK
jgi:protein-disulfide isomerase